MTPKELLAAYPNATHAIAWVELMCCASELDDFDGFAELVQSGMFIPEIIEAIKETTEGEECPDLVRSQMDHPEFMKYIAGKLGMM